MTEYGNMSLGYGDDHPGQKSFDAALSNANDVIRALRAGVDGVNRWSFVNRGDLDGQWQLIQTFDRDTKTYLKNIVPENEAYYGFGIIARFLSKYSSTVEVSVNQADSLLMSVALLSPKGELTIFVLNPTEQLLHVNLETDSFSGKQFNVYQVTKELVNKPGFKLNPIDEFNSMKRKQIDLPARSITTISSQLLRNEDKGIIEN